LREALEGYAAARAAKFVPPVDRETLQTLYGAMLQRCEEFKRTDNEYMDEKMLRLFLAADTGFHITLIRTTNNRRFNKIFSDFRIIERVFGYYRMKHGRQIIDEACRQHGEILETIIAGDSAGARRAMATHIQSSKEHSLDGIDSLASETVAPKSGLRGLPDDLLWELRDLTDDGRLPLTDPSATT